MKTTTVIIFTSAFLILGLVGFAFLRFEPESRTLVIQETPILKPDQVSTPQSIPPFLPQSGNLSPNAEQERRSYTEDPYIATSESGSFSQNKNLEDRAVPVKLEDGSAKLPPVEQISHSDFQQDSDVIVIVDKKTTQTYLLQKQSGGIFIVYEADNAIGTSDSPTPPGPYKIASKTTQPTWIPPKSIDPNQKKIGPFDQNKDNPLGVAAVRLDKWNIVLHGTNNPATIGKKVSHGCIRHRNDDIMRIYKAVNKGNTVIVTDTLEGTRIDKSMFGNGDAA